MLVFYLYTFVSVTLRHIKLHNNFVCNLITLNILLMINFINSHLLFLSHNTRYIFIKYSLYLTHQDVSIKVHLSLYFVIKYILYNKNIQNKYKNRSKYYTKNTFKLLYEKNIVKNKTICKTSTVKKRNYSQRIAFFVSIGNKNIGIN